MNALNDYPDYVVLGVLALASNLAGLYLWVQRKRREQEEDRASQSYMRQSELPFPATDAEADRRRGQPSRRSGDLAALGNH